MEYIIMLSKFEQVRTALETNSEIIDQLLQMRQNLLSSYCSIAGLKSNPAFPSYKEVNTFCQDLIDYVSAGHFKVYNEIIDHWKSISFQPTSKINHLYLELSKITEKFVNFSDTYTLSSNLDVYEQFDKDLSFLGECLEKRFALEDLLIKEIEPTLL
ncbi:Rsd/AlgQ family anti-sigma factor [Paraphotobacterium marinum]|uniref:Rsd/AlgQ family anti-sigma factor n=2 Tax=Paraphotobacterium marinum TaxID=1755811 RepID=A0A220VCW9_9GAMM|nr:Rsd/AlgQ family anti-sigma factor [Paraphotobacterium marinum]